MSTTSRTILIADDEVRFCRLFKRHFGRLGHEVLIAEDGVEALELFEQHAKKIALVITDIRMPRMTGDALIREIRKRRTDVPILGITGHADLKDKLGDHDNGAYYWIAKPIEDLVLLEPIVRNALRVYDYERKLSEQRAKEHKIALLMREYVVQGPAEAPACMEVSVDLIERAHEDGKNVRPSGDYAEWFERRDGEVVFFLADASGHDDIVASFSVCLSSMVFHRCQHRGKVEVEDVLGYIEGAFAKLRDADVWDTNRYFTFFLGAVDLTTGRLTYASAGHPEAFLIRRGSNGESGPFERLRSTASPIGFNSLLGKDIESTTLEVAPGDLLFLYSDGASEPLEVDNDTQSGIDRLARMVESVSSADTNAVVAGVRSQLEEALGGPKGFDDDTTLMAIRFLGGG